MLSVPSCSVPVSVISPSWHFSQQGPTRSRSPALPGSPALSGPEPNRGAAASPGRDCPPLAGRRYRGGRALPAQPGWKLPLLPGLLHGTAGAGGPVQAQLTQPGSHLLLLPSKEGVAISSLHCHFHRHPPGSCSCVSQEPPMSLLELGLCVSNPVQGGCREHLMIVTACSAVSASPPPLFFSALG